MATWAWRDRGGSEEEGGSTKKRRSKRQLGKKNSTSCFFRHGSSRTLTASFRSLSSSRLAPFSAAAAEEMRVLLFLQKETGAARERTQQQRPKQKDFEERIALSIFMSAPRRRCATSRGASYRAGRPESRRAPRGGRGRTWWVFGGRVRKRRGKKKKKLSLSSSTEEETKKSKASSPGDSTLLLFLFGGISLSEEKRGALFSLSSFSLCLCLSACRLP